VSSVVLKQRWGWGGGLNEGEKSAHEFVVTLLQRQHLLFVVISFPKELYERKRIYQLYFCCFTYTGSL